MSYKLVSSTRHILLVFLVVLQAVAAQKEPFILPMLVGPPPPPLRSSYNLAVADINNSTTIMPERELIIDIFRSNSTAENVAKFIEFYEDGFTFVGGNEFSVISASTGIVGAVYGAAQISGMATSSALSNKASYPFYSRSIGPSVGQTSALLDTLLYFSDIQGIGWTDVAIMAVANEYGIDMSSAFIAKGEDLGIDVLTFQNFVLGNEFYEVELREIKDSGARVIMAFILIREWPALVLQADSHGLIGDTYVWMTGDDLVGGEFFARDDTVAELTRGLIGSFQFVPQTEEYLSFVDRWVNGLDPALYPGSGFPPGIFNLFGYDALFVAAMAIDALDEAGELDKGGRISAELWTEAVRNVKFNGVTGPIDIAPNGDRIADSSINYYDTNERRWKVAFSWNQDEGLEKLDDIIWASNTTEIPDLDIREPFHYWSCHDGSKGLDETGKIISLHTPDGSDIDDIDSEYHCDNFIDCKNLSDESIDCAQNYTALFITFGVITGCLILCCLALLVFVLVFGLFLRFQRLRVASPVFLVLILFSMLVGYISIFAWFGKPHPVACAFQPWLLGISSISMIAALCTKTFRIWRIFRDQNSLRKQKITDLELLFLWSIAMIPLLIILTLWAIISTPTAKMKDVGDNEHYVCATGGFTGEPGGYIFFGILVAYGAVILLLGVFLSIVTRKVPSLFNESKLLAISIYNLGFLSAVIIPVFLVVQPFNPFLAWLFRTIAILYAFTATMLLQFLPIVFRVILVDRFKNVDSYKASSGASSNTTRKTGGSESH